jgi:hypothetical protein
MAYAISQVCSNQYGLTRPLALKFESPQKRTSRHHFTQKMSFPNRSDILFPPGEPRSANSHAAEAH